MFHGLEIMTFQITTHLLNTLKFLSAQESDNVLSARSCFLIGNGKCKQLSDWSELELSTVLDSCALRNLSVHCISCDHLDKNIILHIFKVFINLRLGTLRDALKK